MLHIINSHVKLLKLLFNNYWNSQRNKDTYFFFFKFYNNFEPKEIWFKLLLLLSKESKKSLKISLILFFESFKSFQANFHDIFISEFLNNEWFFQRSWNWMKSLYSLVFWNTIRTVSKFIDWANWVSCCFLFCLFFTNWFLTKKGSRKKKKKEKKTWRISGRFRCLRLLALCCLEPSFSTPSTSSTRSDRPGTSANLFKILILLNI